MELERIRQEIDRIDGELKKLFLERMDFSRQVIEEKKKAGAAVYVPKREKEVLSSRSYGVEKEYFLACRAFFKQIMEISRTYQYSKMTDDKEQLAMLPNGQGKAAIEFCCGPNSGQIAVFLNAAALCGLKAEEMAVKEREDGFSCRICLSGDFSTDMAKAAILQMMMENDSTMIQRKA